MATNSHNNTIVATPAQAVSGTLIHGAAIGNKWPALFAVILGAVLIFGVGFSNLSVSHNAAHDTRHAMTFPCH
ncbi:MAG: CbtB-domain containing protein [Pseudomonadota bacterium]|nr:CbtB-domain containing protein [Pseudomonadota bacterium]